MNFTGKIAEQCNGAAHCDLSSQPTYIHKCGQVSDYLYVSYRCVAAHTIHDICAPQRHTLRAHAAPFSLRSPDFPDEYPRALDCSCAIRAPAAAAARPLALRVLWFSLQDNDYLSVGGRDVSGWVAPAHELSVGKARAGWSVLRFVTDEALAYKGFWLQVGGRRVCRDDWTLVGDTCLKVCFCSVIVIIDFKFARRGS